MEINQASLTVLITVLLINSASPQPIERCLDDFKTYCYACYKTKPLGPILPDSDSCLVYDYIQETNKVRCGVCKPSFAARSSSDGTKVKLHPERNQGLPLRDLDKLS